MIDIRDVFATILVALFWFISVKTKNETGKSMCFAVAVIVFVVWIFIKFGLKLLRITI